MLMAFRLASKHKLKANANLPICLSMSAASSGVALGITPGSLKLVRNNVDMTKMKRAPATAGMAGLT